MYAASGAKILEGMRLSEECGILSRRDLCHSNAPWGIFGRQLLLRRVRQI